MNTRRKQPDPDARAAARLRSAREHKHPTKTAAAKALRIKLPTYTAHENGRRGFSVEQAKEYAAAFNVSVLWLLGIEFDFAKPGLVQPHDKALPEQETREGEVRTAVDPSRVSQLRDEIETAFDLMTVLDKAGDGIAGDVGHGVSAVALAARAALDNARSMLRAMEAGSTLVNATRGSRMCTGMREEEA